MAAGSLDGAMLFIIGSPGAGKGTLCRRLCKQFGWAHISVGDELRRLVHDQGTDDEVIKNCVLKGELIPVDRLASILKARTGSLQDQGFQKIVIDGFPRKEDQIDVVQTAIGKPDLVICLDCPQASARLRVLNRRNAERADTDTEEVFDRRYKEFTANNEDIVAYYDKAGIVERVDTSGNAWSSFASLVVILQKRGFALALDSA